MTTSDTRTAGWSLPRMSTPLDRLQGHFEIVVVGSGYGGAITASRLARAGRQVCLLEQGREFHPGEYPDTEPEALEEMQLHTGEHVIGRRTGLYDIRYGGDISVFKGCGLGGTSLVNANVALEADPRLFDDPAWPAALRDPNALDGEYDRARSMLQPTPLPDDRAQIKKLQALAESARVLPGADFYRPPINVTFDDGPNAVGVEQHACAMCGDCVSGCNFGAKNTLLMNYLPDAYAHGATIFTQVSVSHVERDGERWRVQCQLLDTGREAFDAPLMPITADVVVLAAGTLGSTEILLRSKAKGLPTSDQVGHRFTGNGDVLAFSYNSDQEIDGIGWGHRRGPQMKQVGPCITGIIDLRDTPVVTEGMVVEEGVVPGGLSAFLPPLFAAAGAAVGTDTDKNVADWVRERGRELESLVRGPYRGADRNTQTYLVMTHDSGDGVMELVDDRLEIRWKGVGDEPIFDRVDHNLHEATEPLGGTYVRDPIWTKLLGKKLVTVHPLGGCVMSDDASTGVVNDKGQVFSGTTGTAAYPGLYVSDGSVVPRPLGVNPLLTISALAERCVALLAADRGWTIPYDLPAPPPKPAPAPTIGVEMTERMAGWLSAAVTDDYAAAAEQGKTEGAEGFFVLTIVFADLDATLKAPAYTAKAVGTVTAKALSDKPLIATDGTIVLFSTDADVVGEKHMDYRLHLTDEAGNEYYFVGHKNLGNDSVLDSWRDTTTLYTTIHAGRDESGPVRARGILTISLPDFARQLKAMRILNAPDTRSRLAAEARFGAGFAGQLYHVYGGIVAGPTLFDPDAPPRKKRPLRAPAPEPYPFRTEDRVDLLLTRYHGGSKGPVLLSHGLGVSSLIFSIDTIHTNLVEYLCAHGYDVWLLDYRASILLPSATTQFSGDEIAAYDYPAAVAKVREVTLAPDVQVVAHCFGSTTFFMAMLAGLEGVRSAVSSQIATNVVAPAMTRFKSGVHLPDLLEKLGIESLTAQATTHERWYETLFDRALEVFPMQDGEECSSAVCHRISFLYALLYEHEQLNTATHDALHEMFGVANIEAFEHLALLVRKGTLVDRHGNDVYMPHLDRLAIPITFVHGAENVCFLPESTLRTYDLLRQRNTGVPYERHVVPDYGHIDCIFGRDAERDVYPLMLKHLDAR